MYDEDHRKWDITTGGGRSDGDSELDLHKGCS